MTADIILRSDCIFTATGKAPFSGYVAIGGGRILDVGHGEPPVWLNGGETETVELGDRTVSPGFVDVHCFFTGWAAEKIGVDPEDVSNHPALLGNREKIEPLFREYMAMLNARGVTAVKEMGFDDFSGFAELLDEWERADELSLRVSFMSQPVGRPMDLAFGRAMQERFRGAFVRFSGFNRMTDGSISQLEGDLKQPYSCASDMTCALAIDWDAIAAEVRAADEAGFRFSLHAQGDAAIARVLDIYETCCRDESGRLVNRHAITDLEFSDPADLERMGQLGAIAEIYPQIQSIARREEKLRMIREKIGMERGRYYWNRRKMADSGVPLSCGTDLPLLIDDIPESVYCAVGGYFPEDNEPFNRQNMLTAEELMTAWTRGGAYALMRENELGTLENGKRADIAVLSGNIFTTPAEDARGLSAVLTLVDGRMVYRKEELASAARNAFAP